MGAQNPKTPKPAPMPRNTAPVVPKAGTGQPSPGTAVMSGGAMPKVQNTVSSSNPVISANTGLPINGRIQ